jgi:hypothetical protein
MWFENLTSHDWSGFLCPLAPLQYQSIVDGCRIERLLTGLFNSCRLAHRAALPVRLPLRIPALRIVFYHETFVLSPLARFTTVGQ